MSNIKKEIDLNTRLLHWSGVILFISLFFTALMNEFWYSKESIMATFDFSYQMLGLDNLDVDEQLFIARMERRDGWNWHFWLGIGLSVVFFIKLIKLGLGKLKFHKTLNIYFIVLTTLMFFTGLVLYFRINADIDFDIESIYLNYENGTLYMSQYLIDISRTIHKYTSWIFGVSVILHISKIIYLENTKRPGIISRMINGGMINEKDIN